MRFVVTGAGGFLGSSLVRELLAETDHDVVAVSSQTDDELTALLERAPYPALRRYSDARGLPPMSEPTVADYAQVGLAFALLRRAGLKGEIDAMGKIRY